MNRSVALSPFRRPSGRPPMLLRSHPALRVEDEALAGRAPRISAGIFCDSPAVLTILQAAMQDRRLDRVTPQISQGGIRAAIAYYASVPTPDLLIIETTADAPDILAGLDRLSSVSDPSTKVILIGRCNDIELYRAIIAKGVSDYLVAPLDALRAIAAVLRLYANDAVQRKGRVCAFLGAKGGVGASTLAHNLAWCMGRERSGPVMLVDLDLQFGTAALNLDLEPSAGFAEQASDPDRLDQALLERTLIQKGKYLHVLPASGRMQAIDPPDAAAVEKLLDLSRQAFPLVILDLPHLHSPWMKATLAAVDDLVIVAAPDLVNLRNAKCLLEILRAARPNDPPPRLVLNQIGIARRAGLSADEFARGLDVEIKTRIAFDPKAFARAAGEGKLIAETQPGSAAGHAIAALARDIDPRQAARRGSQHGKASWLGSLWRANA